MLFKTSHNTFWNTLTYFHPTLQLVFKAKLEEEKKTSPTGGVNTLNTYEIGLIINI